jgi:hypothetical protein
MLHEVHNAPRKTGTRTGIGLALQPRRGYRPRSLRTMPSLSAAEFRDGAPPAIASFVTPSISKTFRLLACKNKNC